MSPRPSGLPVLCAFLALFAAACGSESRSGTRPNVLIVVMDTVRADRSSFSGNDRGTMPRLGAIARQGTTFRNAWSSACWTSPSHASLFTGLRPERHGLYLGNREYLRPESHTLAEYLWDTGYATACLTSNLLIGPRTGLTQGFEFHKTIDDLPAADEPPCRTIHRRGLDWIREQRVAGRPWFLMINDLEPHLTYEPPADWQAKFVDPGVPAELVARSRAFSPEGMPVEYSLGMLEVPDAQWAVMSDLYDAEVASLDDEVGRLVDRLAAEGILDETILIVLSDHGENLGDHGFASHLFSLHRTLLHVPLMIRYPGTFDGGAEVDDVVRLEDVFPTVLELCGVPVPEDLHGETLTGETEGRIARAQFGTASLVPRPGSPKPAADRLRRLRSSLRSAYDGRWHLIVASDGSVELYDVTRDPQELSNLARDEPGQLVRMTGLLPSDPFDR